jgi:signal transduction histidine kinase
MDTEKLIVFLVISSSTVVLLVCAVLFDLFKLSRKRKIIAAQEIELQKKRIDELIMKKEVESVNALIKGKNSERRRISQELHDRLGGILFTAKLYNTNIKKKIAAIQDEHESAISKMTELLDEAVQEVRRISHDLYSGSVSNFGYVVALQQLVLALQEANDINIELSADELPEAVEEKLQFDLYAATQELLSNTLKHSGAEHIDIRIKLNENQLEVTYHDNGKGFDAEATFDGIGLNNIRERVQRHNGTVTVKSSADHGSTFYITIPLNQ